MKLTPEKYIEARKSLVRSIADHAKEQGMTEQQIADKTGFAQPNVHRMLTGRFSPSLQNFLILAEAVGVRIELQPGND